MKSVQIMLRVIERYDQSIEEAVKLGCYDITNPDFNSANFPPDTTKTGKKESAVIFFEYHHNATTEEIKADMDRKGFMPIGPTELLAIGEQHPLFQEGRTLPALRSSWTGADGETYFPCLTEFDGERVLSLIFVVKGRWPEEFLFGAVPKGAYVLPPSNLPRRKSNMM